jgi:hypothetical protein
MMSSILLTGGDFSWRRKDNVLIGTMRLQRKRLFGYVSKKSGAIP